jgi:predicted membrane-bound spermidine synthase
MMSRWFKLFLYGSAALVGGAVLVIELVGTRLLTPWLGQSHYVWTAQISVTLSALAAGYALGGRWSRHGHGAGTLYLALAAAGASLVAAVLAAAWVTERTLSFSLGVSTLVASTMLFFVPLTLLATLSPLLAAELSRAVDEPAAPGPLLGRILAISTVGSIGGALLSAFVLIPHLAVSTSLYATAALLLTLSAAYIALFARRTILTAGPLVLLILITLGALGTPTRGDDLIPQGLHELERAPSPYGMLQVLQERQGPRRFLMNDNLMQAAVDTKEHKSAAVFADLVLSVLRGFRPDLQRVLCIGLGAGIIPMELVADGTDVDVVEINPEIERLAARWFGYRPDVAPVRIADGRTFLHATSEQWDAVIIDAFLGESVPAHLVTVEALRTTRRHLRPGGVIVIDAFAPSPGGNDFLVTAVARTLQAVFAEVRAYQVLGNLVFIAGDRLEPPESFDVTGTYRYSRSALEFGLAHPVVLHPERGMVLTDRHNPLDAYEAQNAAIRRRTWTAQLFNGQ